MKCLIMFPIFTIINLIVSLWAPAQSSRGCGCLAPLCSMGLASCLPGTTGDALHITSSQNVKNTKQLTVVGNEVNLDGEL